MPEFFDNKQVFSLQEVCKSIRKTIENRYQSTFWVKAEMNKLNLYSHSGHCYPELVEKEDSVVKAQMKANLWKDDYNRVNQQFLAVLKEPLKDGIKILFAARITFDAVHGISLRITDIDPSYTLGDMEKEKLATIAKLKEENLFALNKSLFLPLLPQRIAIISVETSKGYADFMQVLQKNEWGYRFFYFLFPSLLQGEKAVDAIINQLNQIIKVKTYFDAVVIIRGGGGDVGLSCYNNYELAKTIAAFPLPVLTGIGHATNETVVEMIAFQNAITPTKLAEFFLQKCHNFAVPVKEAEQKIIVKAQHLIKNTYRQLDNSIRLFKAVCENKLNESQNILKSQIKTLGMGCFFVIKNQKQQLIIQNQKLTDNNTRFFRTKSSDLNILEKNISLLHPQNTLRRGYSITLFNEKSLRNTKVLKNGEMLKTILYEGEVISKVQLINSQNE